MEKGLPDITRSLGTEEKLRIIADYNYSWEYWKGPDGKFLYVSPSSTRITGFSPEEFINKPGLLPDIIHPEDKDAFLVHMQSPPGREYHSIQHEEDVRIIRKDGEVRWIAHVCRRIYDHKGNYLGIRSSNRDITERKTAELTRQVVYNISNLVSTSLRLHELVEKIVAELGKVMDCSNLFIAFYNKETGMVSTLAKDDHAENIPVWPAKGSLTGWVIQNRKPLLIKHPEFEKLLSAGEISLIGKPSEIWLGVPLFNGDEAIGAIVNQSFDNPDAFDEKSLEVLVFIARQIEMSIRQQKAIEELIAAKELAQQSSRLKSAFLNNLSHEIRTPLNSITGFSELLNEPPYNPERIGHLTRVILLNSERLLHVMDNLVNISTIEAKLIRLQEKPVNLPELMKGVYQKMQPHAEIKALKFRFVAHIPESLSEVNVDAYKLKCVLLNLIDNAIKFTQSGHVEFGCSIQDNRLSFFVADTGDGIAEDFREHMFNKFRKFVANSDYNLTGIGLGLNIARSYIELMQGQIWVESDPGKGSLFKFVIPWKPVSVKSTDLEQDDLQPKEKKVILVAEDEEHNYELIQGVLNIYTDDIRHAWNGQEAVDFLEKLPKIDLVLMDIKMPVLNGLEATRIIKAKRPAVPIVALSAYTMPEDRENALNAGCDDYIAKPVSIHELMNLVKKYF